MMMYYCGLCSRSARTLAPKAMKVSELVTHMYTSHLASQIDGEILPYMEAEVVLSPLEKRGLFRVYHPDAGQLMPVETTFDFLSVSRVCRYGNGSLRLDLECGMEQWLYGEDAIRFLVGYEEYMRQYHDAKEDL